MGPAVLRLLVVGGGRASPADQELTRSRGGEWQPAAVECAAGEAAALGCGVKAALSRATEREKALPLNR